MNKKLLVSVMMATPAAAMFAAQWAEVDGGMLQFSITDASDWTASEQAYPAKNDAGIIMCDFRGASMTFQQVGMPQGTYVVNVPQCVNATLYINGEAVAKEDEDGNALASVEMELGGKVLFKVIPNNPDEDFGIGDVQVTFKFNFNDAKAAINNLWSEVPDVDPNNYLATLNTTANKNFDGTAVATLATSATNNTKARNAAKAKVDALASADAAALAGLYTTYGMYEVVDEDGVVSYESALQTEIATVKKNITKLNEDLDNEWTRFNNYTANKAANNQFAADYTMLVNALTAQNPGAKPTGTSAAEKYAAAQVAVEVQAAKDKYNAFKAAVAETYKGENMYKDLTSEKDAFAQEVQDILAYIQGITYANCIADYNAYQEFTKTSDVNGNSWAGAKRAYDDAFYGLSTLDFGDSTAAFYQKFVNDKQTELAAIYEAFQKDCAINVNGGVIEGSAAALAQAQQEVANFKAAADQFVQDAQAAVDTNEANKVIADKVLKGFQNQYNAEVAFINSDVFKDLTAADQASVKAKNNAVKAALDALSKYIDDEYAAYELGNLETTQVDEVDNVKNAIDAYNNLFNRGSINFAIMDCDRVWQKIVNQSKEAGIAKYNLSSKFAEAHDNILNAISAYQNYDPADPTSVRPNVIEIQTNIDNFEAGWDTLYDAVTAIVSTNADNQAMIDELKAMEADTSNIVTIPGLANTQKWNNYKIKTYNLTKLQQFANGYVTDLDNTVKNNPNVNDLITACGELDQFIAAGKYHEGTAEKNLTTDGRTLTDLLEEATGLDTMQGFQRWAALQNYNYVNSAADLTDLTNQKYRDLPADFYCKDEITSGTLDSDKLPEDYTGPTSIANVGDLLVELQAANDEDLLDQANLNIAGFAAAIAPFYEKVAAITANAQAWVDVNKEVDAQKTLITSIYAEIQDLTQAAARDHFRDLLDGGAAAQHKGGYLGQLNDAKDAIDEAYEPEPAKDKQANWEDTPGYAAKEKETLDVTLKNLKKLINAVKTNCIANQTAYSNQVTEVNGVYDRANALIDAIDDDDAIINENINLNKTQLINEVKDVTKVLDTINTEIANNFADGAAADKNAEFEAAIKNAKDALDAIETKWNKGYPQAVFESNVAFLNDNGANADKLDQLYRNAIAAWEAYNYEVTNEGLKQALLDAIQANGIKYQDIQDAYARIRELKAQINPTAEALVDRANNDNCIVLTSATLHDGNPAVVAALDLINEGEDINTLLTTWLNDLNSVCKATADTYYTNLEAEATTIQRHINLALVRNGVNTLDGIDDLDEVLGLEDAAFSGPDTTADGIMEAINTAIASAQDAYSKFQDKEAQVFVEQADGMCNVLDSEVVLPYKTADDQAKFVMDSCNAQWKGIYNTANARLAELEAALEEVSDHPDYQAAYDLIMVGDDNNPALDKVVYDMNEEYNSEDDAYTRLGNYEYNLYSVMKRIYNAVNDIYVDIENNAIIAANQAILNPMIADRQAELNDLLAYVNTLAQANTYVAPLQQIIDNAKDEVNRGVSLLNEFRMDRLKELLEEDGFLANDIVYNTEGLYNDEVALAETELLYKARQAFNNLKRNQIGSTEELDGYDKLINETWPDALSELEYDVDDVAGSFAALRDIEQKVADLINKMQLKYTDAEGKPVVDTAAANLAALNATNAAIVDTLDAWKADIDEAAANCPDFGADERAAYSAEIANLLDQLESLKTAYTDEDNMIIVNDGKYAYMMGLIKAQIAADQATWAADKAKAQKYQDNTNAYNALNAELAHIASNLEFAHRQAEIHESWYDETRYNQLRAGIDNVQKQLDNDFKAVNLTVGEYGTQLGQYDWNLEYYVEWFVKNALTNAGYTFAGVVATNATDAIDAIEYPEKENGFPVRYLNTEDIVADLLAQYDAAEQVRNEIGNESSIYGYYEEVSQDERYDWYDQETDTYYRWVSYNTDEAIDAYKAAIDRLDDITSGIEGIVNAAEDDKIIVGDVDKNDELNVLDIQKLIKLIGENVALEGADEQRADVNNDGAVNVADVTQLIQIWLDAMVNGAPRSPQAEVAKYMPVQSGNNSFFVEEVAGVNGNRRFAVVLSNDVDFAAGQLDIVLPDHARVAGVAVAERASQLDSYVFDNGDFTRVILASMDNSNIRENNGAVLFIDVEGNAEIEIENMIFADAFGHSYNVAAAGSTGVGIIDSIKDGFKAVYNAAGQKLNGLTKGINIVRNADGSVTKKIGK